MIKILKEVSAPSIFTKGLLRYRQGRLADSRRLIRKSGEWMRELREDDFYKAALICVESELGMEFEPEVLQRALDSIVDSPYKHTADHKVVCEGLKQKIAAIKS